MSKSRSPEEVFYDHIMLGLLQTLSNIPRICNVWSDKRMPCEKAQVANWEQRHSVYLPEDMKKFYLSTDGFLLQWCYQYAPGDIRRVGYIHIPHLLQISLLRENVEPNATVPTTSTSTSTICISTNNTSTSTNLSDNSTSSSSSLFQGTSSTVLLKPSTSSFSPCLQEANLNANDGDNTTALAVAHDEPLAIALMQSPAPPPVPVTAPAKDIWGNPIPRITTRAKIFELNNVNDVAKVCLVYETSGSNSPKVYLLELLPMKWVFLADTFSEYLRMAIAHLGLPYWQLCFSSFGLPSWAEQLFMLLAPHLLEDHEPRCERLINPAPEYPHNIIDPSVFRVKPKSVVKPSK